MNLYAYLKQVGFKVMTVSVSKDGPGQTNKRNIVYARNNKALLFYLAKQKRSLYHIHSSGVGSFRKVFAGVIASMLSRSKIILTLHSGSFPIEVRQKGIITKLSLQLIFRFIQHFICVNDLIRNEVISLGIPIRKSSVIPAFSLICDLSREELPPYIQAFYQKHYPIIASMGYTYRSHYGFDLAIRAVTALRSTYPNIGLIIAGPQNTGQYYETLRSKYDLINKPFILLAGEVGYPKNLLIIKESNLFLRPTDHDGDAVSIREALAFNIPVVASQTARRPNGISLFEVRDYEGMLDEMEKILNNKLGQNLSINESVDIENLDKVREIYDSLRS